MNNRKFRKAMSDGGGQVGVLGRTIHVSGSIDSTVSHEFGLVLAELDARKGLITIRLNSDGGDVTPGWAMYDAIKMARNKVRIEVYGEAASIAALIFMAGDERVMSPNARFMIHDGECEFGAQPMHILRARIIEMEDMHQAYIKEICDAVNADRQTCGKPTIARSQFFEWSRVESTFSASECLKIGFATKIFS